MSIVLKIFRTVCVFPILAGFSQIAGSQTSTFDTDNESWRTTGDPSTEIPGWVSSGGNPGGYIKGVDAAVGGIWYFRAPAKFTGNKCEAYGRYLRWDQTINGVPNQQGPGGSPDVLLFGAGLTLAFDNPNPPGTSWTHYDVLLREDAGWRLNNNNGPVPTQAQFLAVLSNVSGLQIRGEFITGDDNGCLDNVVLESSFRFALDSTDQAGNFTNDTVCTREAPLCSSNALLITEKRVDSIVIRLSFPQPGGIESISVISSLPPTVGLSQPSPGYILLYNLGSASAADFITALQALYYVDNGPNPPRNTRILEVRVYTECGEMGVRFAYLPVFPPLEAGLDASIQLCYNEPGPVDLADLLSGAQPGDAFWIPALHASNGLFDVRRDLPGMYAFVIPPTGDCPGDTAFIEVQVAPNIHLGQDTILCNGDTYLLQSPESLVQWQWNTGSRQRVLTINTPGVYGLEGSDGQCNYSDSLQVGFYQCTPCVFYAPNVFSPNDDGYNDEWQVFLPCAVGKYQLQVYDRWGNLVFAASAPEDRWDGRYQGREVPPGVYIWSLEWEGDLLGQPKRYREKGEVTVVR